MKCPFCAEEIQAEAIVCRFCGAVKTGDRWEMSPPGAASKRPGTFTLRFAGAAFVFSALFEVLSIGSPVPMFGALREGAVAVAYHGAYVLLFGALGVGLWQLERWGYRLLFGATCFYTADNLRYVLDRTGMKAQIDRELAPYAAIRDMIDVESAMQMERLTVILFVACWWGFVLYARARRSAFAA